MDDNRLTTQTRTGTSIGTKLMVATLALFAANGLAFAAIPAATKMQFQKKYRSSEDQFRAVKSKKTVCIDSDGGNNPETAGTVSIKTRDNRTKKKSARYSDRCDSNGNLYEYSCSKDNQLRHNKHSATDSTICEDGAMKATALPDLIISNVEFDFETDRFNIYMRNIGEATMVPTIWYEQIFNLSWLDATREQIGTYSLGRAFNDQAIEPGEEALVYQHVPIVREGFEGARYLSIMADPDETIDESNEENNSSEWEIPLAPTSSIFDENILHLNGSGGEGMLIPGERDYLELSITNPNSYDALFKVGNVRLQLEYHPPIGVRASSTASLLEFLSSPSTTPIELRIYTDSGETIARKSFLPSNMELRDGIVAYLSWYSNFSDADFEDIIIDAFTTEELTVSLRINNEYISDYLPSMELGFTSDIEWENIATGDEYTASDVNPSFFYSMFWPRI